MPFLVDYTPVSSLGTLAMSAGEETGRAQSRQAALAHQRQMDLLTMQINQRNRELTYQAALGGQGGGGGGYTSAAQAAPQQTPLTVDTQRRMLSQGLAVDQYKQAQELAQKQAETAATTRTREEIQAEFADREHNERVQQFAQWAASRGMNNEQAEQAWQEFIGREQGFAPKETGSGRLVLPPGDIARTAAQYAAAGDFSTVLQSLEGRLDVFDQDAAVQEVIGAQIETVLQMPNDQLMQILQDPYLPDPVRQAIVQKISAPRNAPAQVRPKPNTAPTAPSTGGAYQSMSDQDIISALTSMDLGY